MKFSPRIHPKLVRALAAIDDERSPIAETWRELGRRARRMHLTQPSYESVRRLVHTLRAVKETLASFLRRALRALLRLLCRLAAAARRATTRAVASGARSPCGTASPRAGP